LRTIAIIILLLVLASVYAAPVSAANITATFDKENFQTSMNLSVHQNMTKFVNQSIALDASQNSNMSAAFNDALRKVDPSASFSALTIRVWSNATWLNLTIATSIVGVSERKGDIAAVNTTWRMFNVSADLRAGNLSYNTVGREYFRPVLDFYANASLFVNDPNATIRAVNFFVDETQSVTGPEAANYVGNFTVLDFRPLNVPIDQWERTYNLSNNTTTWRYTPPVIFAASVEASQLNKSVTLFSSYTYSAEIIIPGLAQAAGNILRVDVGTGQKEWIMTGVVVLSLGLVVVIQVMFRAKKKAAKLGRR